MWNWIKRRLGLLPATDQSLAPLTTEVKWLTPDKNPWPYPVLDLRPFTMSVFSASTDPRMAENSVSWGQEDGLQFRGISPASNTVIPCDLVYRTDRILADGALFIPTTMDQKWAIFFHSNQIIAIRSWTRTVEFVADVTLSENLVAISSIRGDFVNATNPEMAIAWFDFLIQTHVLREMIPLWLPEDLLKETANAANFAFSLFGNLACFATDRMTPREVPQTPIRSHSLLHIAIARADKAEAIRLLESGLPIDLLANDGLTPLHWSLGQEGIEMLEFLLDRGAPVDSRSAESATPLMNAVQARSLGVVNLLLDRGADPDARDHRGFTAIHRAAEMGELKLVQVLIERGADTRIQAEGYLPIDLARLRKWSEIESLLSNTADSDH